MEQLLVRRTVRVRQFWAVNRCFSFWAATLGPVSYYLFFFPILSFFPIIIIIRLLFTVFFLQPRPVKGRIKEGEEAIFFLGLGKAEEVDT